MFRVARKHFILVWLSLMLIQACSTTVPTGRYSQHKDSAPQFEYGELLFVEPTPSYEPYSIWTSRPYTVLGGYYTPMLDSKGYEEIGYASWYGQKFHGHTTANGEIFDMFALTAAHKTLPLPSFLRVTNLENNKSTTVRVNDRGPFHGDRILDLSYGAAKKLDFHSKGVTRIKVEIIHVSKSGLVSIGKNQSNDILLASAQADTNSVAALPAPAIPAEELSTTDIRRNQQASVQQERGTSQDALLFVQVTATSDAGKAKDLATGLSNLLQVPNSIPKLNEIYRLHLGPIENEQTAQKLIQDLKKMGFDKAFKVEFTPQ